jgi:hypothetical protein
MTWQTSFGSWAIVFPDDWDIESDDANPIPDDDGWLALEAANGEKPDTADGPADRQAAPGPFRSWACP